MATKISFSLIILSLILVFCLSQPAVAQTKKVTSGGAQNLVNRYCAFLASGDTAAILDILGGKLLQKRADLLKNNPSYGNFIADHYRHAEFEIENVTSITDTKAAVDLSVFFSNGSIQKLRFIIEPSSNSLKIVDEVELN